MRTIKLLSIVCLLSILVSMNAQTSNKNDNVLSFTDILAASGDSLLETNQIAQYLKYDFSAILKPKKILGIIGDNYQRLHIRFLNVEKNQENPSEYIVHGQSKVNNNICDFKGKITIKNIQETIRTMHGVDDEYKGKYLVSGLLTAGYVLYEDSTQNHPGIFSGTLQTLWYIDNNNNLLYDDMFSFSDIYFNNAFVGTWRAYRSDKKKICNFGEYRVPSSK